MGRSLTWVSLLPVPSQRSLHRVRRNRELQIYPTALEVLPHFRTDVSDNDGAAACFTSNKGGSSPSTTFLCGSRRCTPTQEDSALICATWSTFISPTQLRFSVDEHRVGAASEFCQETYRCVPTSLRYAPYLARQISRTTADALGRQHRDPSSSMRPERARIRVLPWMTSGGHVRKATKKFGYQHHLQQAPQGFFREATTGTPAMPTTRLRQPRPVTASVNGVVNGWCVRVPPTQVCALSHASWCRSLPCNELRLSCWSGQAQCSCRHVV